MKFAQPSVTESYKWESYFSYHNIIYALIDFKVETLQLRLCEFLCADKLIDKLVSIYQQLFFYFKFLFLLYFILQYCIASVCMQLSPGHLRFSYIYHALFPEDFSVHFPRMTFSYITTVKLPSSLDMLSSLHQLPIFQFHQLECAS